MFASRLSTVLLFSAGLAACGGAPEGALDDTAAAPPFPPPRIFPNPPISKTPRPPSPSPTRSRACGVASDAITSFSCWTLDKKGNRVDAPSACDITLSGDQMTVNAAQLGSGIDWTVHADDGAGNAIDVVCQTSVVKKRAL